MSKNFTLVNAKKYDKRKNVMFFFAQQAFAKKGVWCSITPQNSI